MATAIVLASDILGSAATARVYAKVVGYVTGATLFILGLVLIFLNYIESINMVFRWDFVKLLGIYFGYIIISASLLLILRYTISIPDYIFRKMLYIVAFMSILLLVLDTDI